MRHLECPAPSEWDSRQKWFEKQLFESEKNGGYIVGEQACALAAETQSCFCAGAWTATIILAMATIECQIREAEVGDFHSALSKITKQMDLGDDIETLRRRRNALVHTDHGNEALTVDQQWFDREMLEKEARSAVEIMISVLYMSPWV